MLCSAYIWDLIPPFSGEKRIDKNGRGHYCNRGIPCRTHAARNACEKGADILLLEKKEEIGNPPHPANSFFKGMLDRCGEKADPSYVVHYLKGMKIISPEGREVIVETPGYSIDKSNFDRFYAEKVMKTGVELRTGIEARDIWKEGREFAVITSEGTLRSKLVIISDGINSKIASRLGMKTMKHPEDIAWGTELDIRAPGLGKPEMFEYYVGNHAPGWKTTYAPREEIMQLSELMYEGAERMRPLT